MLDTDYPIFHWQSETESNYGYTDHGDPKDFWLARKRSVFSYQCPYCKTNCKRDRDAATYDGSRWQEDIFSLCLFCGWWSFKSEGDNNFVSIAAVLKEFSIVERDLPLEPLVAYVARYPDLIHRMHPSNLNSLSPPFVLKYADIELSTVRMDDLIKV